MNGFQPYSNPITFFQALSLQWILLIPFLVLSCLGLAIPRTHIFLCIDLVMFSSSFAGHQQRNTLPYLEPCHPKSRWLAFVCRASRHRARRVHINIGSYDAIAHLPLHQHFSLQADVQPICCHFICTAFSAEPPAAHITHLHLEPGFRAFPSFR